MHNSLLQYFFTYNPLFTQHDAKQNPGYDYLLRDVARATSASPTYFEPARVHSLSEISYPLVDGGVFANNPALCAYAEAMQLFESKIEERRSRGKKAAVSEMAFTSIMASLPTNTLGRPLKFLSKTSIC